MKIHRFFMAEPIGHATTITVTDEALIHQWKKVFRFVTGDTLIVFDGSGSEWTASFEYLDSQETKIKLLDRRERDSSLPPLPEVHLYMALTKKDTFEWIVEKATELGIARIIPVLAQRSEKKDLNFDRLKKILIEASEQSGRLILPRLYDITELERTFEAIIGKTIVWDPRGSAFSRANDLVATHSTEPLAVFIGPEGGWTPQELEFFQEKGALVRSCGENILRAETAAVALLSLLILPQ